MSRLLANRISFENNINAYHYLLQQGVAVKNGPNIHLHAQKKKVSVTGKACPDWKYRLKGEFDVPATIEKTITRSVPASNVNRKTKQR